MWHPHVMNRVGFTKVARQLGCQLYIPFPGEQVAVLKTGLLLHIEAYMQVRLLLALHAHSLCWKPYGMQAPHAVAVLHKVQCTWLPPRFVVDVWSAQGPRG